MQFCVFSQVYNKSIENNMILITTNLKKKPTKKNGTRIKEFQAGGMNAPYNAAWITLQIAEYAIHTFPEVFG